MWKEKCVNKLLSVNSVAVTVFGTLMFAVKFEVTSYLQLFTVFMLAMIVVLVNFAVDMLYVYLNPQIRVR
jgi:ABC-type dipeptide/oligopeptide/nickel transport system permease component